jgi:hypothetical protein
MYWSASSTSYASCAACSCDAVQLLGAGEVSDRGDCAIDWGDCECAASALRETCSSSESVECDRVRVRGSTSVSVSDRWRLKQKASVRNQNPSARASTDEAMTRPCPVLVAYFRHHPSIAHSAACPRPAHSRLGLDRLPAAGACLEDVAVG